MKINLIVIRTTQLHQLAKQYEALGICFDYHQHGKGPFHYAANIDSMVFEIYPSKKEIAQPETRLGFCVDNITEAILKLTQADWKIITQPTQKPWGLTATVQDLDGRKVDLTQA